ncbi:hypothetical protein C8A01DRAFT_15208 [Parachaetomium inaequale]|uniref:Zn(2)-C6 fungal-type domain-containing protein n=1 Tax=Parachaetomium inaequale TaxID=2588326 RepID=A0AAN6SS19_9PEZI|nr:hypothetical protein C8A01DRAFT_15208 [Parachaetomium inaequale]
MVYCGKPSKGCQMCRTRRIKCDETKPTCNQCAKARRQCPGYKDEFDLLLRNENVAAKRRALKLAIPRRGGGGGSNASKKSKASDTSSSSSSSSSSSTSSSLSASSSSSSSSSPTTPSPFTTTATANPRPPSPLTQSQKQHQQLLLVQTRTTPPLSPTPIHLPPESLAPCHFLANFVLTPRQDGTRGFLEYLRMGVLGKAFAEYSWALRATQAALVDPERWKSDGVLAAVLLLGMFENITAKQLGSFAWGSHVEGAIQLVKARGRSQLKTKVGVQLFIAVRTQLIIHTLSTGTAPTMGADWWLQDAVIDSTAAECQRLSLKTGELRAEITRLITGVTRTPENTDLVQDLMHRAQDLDDQVSAWMDSVPEAWQFKTLCWQLQSLAVPGGRDYSRAEVFPGRVDAYSDFWVAAVWNQARTTRLVLNSIIVRCAAWVCSPVDYRTTPEYAIAARVCVETISDILASVPYYLGWHNKRKDLLPNDGSKGFACGDDDGMKGLAGYFLTWPLACMMTQDYTTDAQRAYIRGRLKHIGDELGVKYAHILTQLQVRVPSLLIRSDGLLARPYPMAHDFEKLVSSARQAYPLPQGVTLKPAAAGR